MHAPQCFSPSPVSYTHLDVYKRQAYDLYQQYEDEATVSAIYPMFLKTVDRKSGV